MKNIFNKEEILLSDILSFTALILKKSYKLSVLVLLSFIIIGTIEFKSADLEYESEANVIIDGFEKTGSVDGLSSLLGANISLNAGVADVLGPQLFEEVIVSKAFLNDLVIEIIPTNSIGKDSTTLEKYFNKPIKKSFYQKLFNSDQTNPTKLSNNNQPKSLIISNELSTNFLFNQNTPPIVQLSDVRFNAISEMKGRIKFKLENKNAKVSVKMPDPVLSAIVTKLVLEKLIDYVTLYKTKKNIDNISYLEAKYSEAEGKYKNALSSYSSFKDQNIGSIFQTSQNSEQLLNNNLSISFNIFNQVALKLEQAKITLKQEAPMFFILEPISIPSEPSDPNLAKILIKNIAYSLGLILIIFVINLIKFFNE